MQYLLKKRCNARTTQAYDMSAYLSYYGCYGYGTDVVAWQQYAAQYQQTAAVPNPIKVMILIRHDR